MRNMWNIYDEWARKADAQGQPDAALYWRRQRDKHTAPPNRADGVFDMFSEIFGSDTNVNN